MLLAIEGIDGAGKRTQASLLKDRIERGGLRADILSFPRYGKTVFARSVADYLNGKFGPLHDVDPHLAALLYAGDRAESRDELQLARDGSDVLILDRYVASNYAYQGARIEPARRWEFIDWLADIEHGANRLPYADLTLYLDVPVETAARMVARKGEREYTSLRADIHESDLLFLAECRRVYQDLAERQFRSHWTTISCVNDGGELLDAAGIHEAIWSCVTDALTARCGSTMRTI